MNWIQLDDEQMTKEEDVMFDVAEWIGYKNVKKKEVSNVTSSNSSTKDDCDSEKHLDHKEWAKHCLSEKKRFSQTHKE